MNELLFVLFCASCSAIAMTLPSAIKTELDNQAAVISEHKQFLQENIEDIDDDVTYQASKQYQDAKHANQFLSRAYRDE